MAFTAFTHGVGHTGVTERIHRAFVMLPILLLTEAPQMAAGTWLANTLLYEIGGGILLGVFTGGVAGWLLTWGERQKLLEEASFLAFTLALALLVLGGAGLAGVNGVIAAFVAGLAFDNMVGGGERAEEARIQEAVNQFFALPVFALIGLVAPVEGWRALGWPGIALAAAVLILRRLPGMLVMRRWMSPVDHRADALFIGWFGPIGVSALFYASEAIQRIGEQDLWAITSLIICVSVVVHGMTASPLTVFYGSRLGRETSGGR